MYPVVQQINAKDFGEAVKNFVKINRFMNVEQMIIRDQYKHMQANIRYDTVGGGRKKHASIRLNPYEVPAPLIGWASTNPNTPYPASYLIGPSTMGGVPTLMRPAIPMVGMPLSPFSLLPPAAPATTPSTGAPVAPAAPTDGTTPPAASAAPTAPAAPAAPAIVTPAGYMLDPRTKMLIPIGGIPVGVPSGMPVPVLAGPMIGYPGPLLGRPF